MKIILKVPSYLSELLIAKEKQEIENIDGISTIKFSIATNSKDTNAVRLELKKYLIANFLPMILSDETTIKINSKLFRDDEAEITIDEKAIKDQFQLHRENFLDKFYKEEEILKQIENIYIKKEQGITSTIDQQVNEKLLDDVAAYNSLRSERAKQYATAVCKAIYPKLYLPSDILDFMKSAKKKKENALLTQLVKYSKDYHSKVMSDNINAQHEDYKQQQSFEEYLDEIDNDDIIYNNMQAIQNARQNINKQFESLPAVLQESQDINSKKYKITQKLNKIEATINGINNLGSEITKLTNLLTKGDYKPYYSLIQEKITNLQEEQKFIDEYSAVNITQANIDDYGNMQRKLSKLQATATNKYKNHADKIEKKKLDIQQQALAIKTEQEKTQEQIRVEGYYQRLMNALGGDTIDYAASIYTYQQLKAYKEQYQTECLAIQAEINSNRLKYVAQQDIDPCKLDSLNTTMQVKYDAELAMKQETFDAELTTHLGDNYNNKTYKELLERYKKYEDTKAVTPGLIPSPAVQNKALMLHNVIQAHERCYAFFNAHINDYKQRLAKQTVKKIFFANRFEAKNTFCDAFINQLNQADNENKLSNLLQHIHENVIFTQLNKNLMDEEIKGLIATMASKINDIDQAAATIINCSLMIKQYQKELEKPCFNPLHNTRRQLKKDICNHMQNTLKQRDKNIVKLQELFNYLKDNDKFTDEALEGKRMKNLRHDLLKAIEPLAPQQQHAANNS